jgi:hypothetical protein
MRYGGDPRLHLKQGVYDYSLSCPRVLVMTCCGWHDRVSVRLSAATFRTIGLLAPGNLGRIPDDGMCAPRSRKATRRGKYTKNSVKRGQRYTQKHLIIRCRGMFSWFTGLHLGLAELYGVVHPETTAVTTDRSHRKRRPHATHL